MPRHGQRPHCRVDGEARRGQRSVNRVDAGDDSASRSQSGQQCVCQCNGRTQVDRQQLVDGVWALLRGWAVPAHGCVVYHDIEPVDPLLVQEVSYGLGRTGPRQVGLTIGAGRQDRYIHDAALM